MARYMMVPPMGVECHSIALVSIVPDCAAITQHVMTATGETEDHLSLFPPWSHRGYAREADLFWKRWPCLCKTPVRR